MGLTVQLIKIRMLYRKKKVADKHSGQDWEFLSIPIRT